MTQKAGSSQPCDQFPAGGIDIVMIDGTEAAAGDKAVELGRKGAMALVDSCLQTSGEALADYADGLDAMAKTYSETEQTTTSMMGKP